MRNRRRSLAITLSTVVTTSLFVFSIVEPAFAYLALIRQGVESAEVPNAGDHFGYTVVAGDFNNDGYDDLAVAAPSESNSLVPSANHGLITVNWGTSYGLRHTGASVLSPGVPLDNVVRFGYAMAVGDFDGDGFDDLAVGLPDNDISAVAVDAGSVWIYEGFAGGIQLAPSLMFSENETGGTAEAYDHFGFTLATGDFDHNGYDDLAVTALGEDGDTGDVTIIYSVGPAGLATATAATFSPAILGFSIGTSGGWFGKGLASGDLDQDTHDDLVIGAPKTIVNGIGSAGRVYVLYGSPVGLSTTGRWKYDTSDDAGFLQDTPLEFGWSVAVGDFRTFAGAGPLQIAAGSPGYEDAGVNDTGAFVLLSHDDASRSVGPNLTLHRQLTTPDIDGIHLNDRMGETMAAGDFDGDGFDDLAVGAPNNNITEQIGLGIQFDAGSAWLYASDAGVGFSQTLITHKTLNDHVTPADNLGRGLAFGRFDGGGRAGLAVGAPFADYFSYEGDPTISNVGVVYVHSPWRQPRNRPHRGSAALDCQGYLIYAQRAWQRMRPASTTKTMTLKLACDAIGNGQNPADPDTVPQWVDKQVGGSTAGHLQGDILRFDDFMKTMMTVSGNDAAMWLGAKMSGQGLTAWSGWSTQSPSFAAAMEAKANVFGMSPATSFTNAAGIDSDDHYTTPYDFALMTFQAINDPCVKTIVDQPTWIITVRRLGLFSPGQYDPINLLYANNFVNTVTSINPSTVGMKGGQTPGALRTGVYNSYVPLAGAHNGAAGFGVWDDDDPIEGAIADCNSCVGAELLAIADLYCQAAALPDEITLPEPTPGPWAYLSGMSSAAEDTAMGLVFNANDSEGNDLGRQIQVDVLRTVRVTPTASVTAVLRHISEFCLAGAETQTVGVSPYQQHDGFRITNRDDVSVSLRITASDPPGYDQTVTLLPDSSFDVPPTSGSNPAPGFQLAVTNLEPREEACIEIQETGYRSQLTLGNGVALPDLMSFRLDRVLRAHHDVWSLEFLGLDAVAGNLLDVSAHDPNATTSVGDGITTAPKPLASRLLPNVPNPFIRNTTIRFDLTVGSPVDLRVYDLRGRVVRNLVSGADFARGRHAVPWDGRDDGGRAVAPGVYFVKLIAGTATDSWRMLLVR